MAKRIKNNKYDKFSTLNSEVPAVISYAVLIALYIAAVAIAKRVLGFQ